MKRMKADHQDPNKGRVFGILAISYAVDPGYLTGHATTAIREWYGITSSADLVGRIQNYLQPGSPCVAYDAFRAAFLARAGEGAQTLTADESWSMAFRAVQEVQGAYANWQEYGQGYIVGHTDYRKTQGDDEQTIISMQTHKVQKVAELSNGIWAQFPLR